MELERLIDNSQRQNSFNLDAMHVSHPFAGLGCGQSPFPVTPDASNYFISDKLKQHLFEILHYVNLRKGFLLITAEVGYGKTTLSRFLMGCLPSPQNNIALMFSSFLQGEDLLKAINSDFGISTGDGIVEQLAALQKFLLAQFEAGHNSVIIIDEAQRLSTESLEVIRQISNLETDTHKLVQIILIAQPELVARLQQEELRQVFSRIALHIKLEGFSASETREYVEFRLDKTCDVKLTADGLNRLHAESLGCPRRINAIMDRCLYLLIAVKSVALTAQIVADAVAELPQGSSRSSRNTSARNAIEAGLKSVQRISRSSVVASLSVLVICASFGLGLLIDSSAEAQINNPGSPLLDAAVVANVSQVLKVSQVLEVPQVLKEPQVSTQTNPLSSTKARALRVERFVQNFALGSIVGRVQQALHAGDLDSLASLLNATPWSLVLVPAEHQWAIKDQESLLIENELGERSALIFWQPEYQIGDFAHGAMSDAVGLLQVHLQALQFSEIAVDNIVGGQTVRALADYQVRRGLIQSGQPDLLTLFLLAQEIKEAL